MKILLVLNKFSQLTKLKLRIMILKNQRQKIINKFNQNKKMIIYLKIVNQNLAEDLFQVKFQLLIKKEAK